MMYSCVNTYEILQFTDIVWRTQFFSSLGVIIVTHKCSLKSNCESLVWQTQFFSVHLENNNYSLLALNLYVAVTKHTMPCAQFKNMHAASVLIDFKWTNHCLG